MGARDGGDRSISKHSFDHQWASAFHPGGVLNAGCCCLSTQQFVYTRDQMLKLIEMMMASEKDPETKRIIKMRIKEEMHMCRRPFSSLCRKHHDHLEGDP